MSTTIRQKKKSLSGWNGYQTCIIRSHVGDFFYHLYLVYNAYIIVGIIL